MNKFKDNDWFRISAANPEGTRWTGKCWYVHNLLKYEFDLQFDIPVTYPATASELSDLRSRDTSATWLESVA
ncbi:putative ubiquitin-fold modifier-conjugating enzyme 1, ubiquitin-conjugating enzyme/RWD [Helianthus annuus]|uniref:Ubiquitin-fold modifier-conjugating enzyme 1 n=1 Tax=Helianthus annuus TaxID=4232 RepID=A0A9K3JS75_HELAN|nr:putative ubiquitin-fold modifier-conjugating enzyme 1, ubiquitin-conjugating enzyme/RWD [Helianthus annuus]